MDNEDIDGIEVAVQLNTDMPTIELWVGGNVAFLSAEQAMQIAEHLAELAGVLEGMIEQAEPANAHIHQAPDTLQ